MAVPRLRVLSIRVELRGVPVKRLLPASVAGQVVDAHHVQVEQPRGVHVVRRHVLCVEHAHDLVMPKGGVHEPRAEMLPVSLDAPGGVQRHGGVVLRHLPEPTPHLPGLVPVEHVEREWPASRRDRDRALVDQLDFLTSYCHGYPLHLVAGEHSLDVLRAVQSA